MASDPGPDAPQNRTHGAPSSNAAEAPDLSPPARAPSHAERCRTLVAGTRSATLCTIARDPAGFPFGSLVTVAFDGAGRPLLLLSSLAEHTQNLEHCSDASILLTEPLDRHKTPLALGRVTLLGACRRVPEGERAELRRTFLAAHEDAAHYVDFKDFAFYRLDPQALRYVGGFGRMSWVSAEDYLRAEPDPLAASAAGILEHMNHDHADSLLAYARGLGRLIDAESATMTAVDRYGFEMAVRTPRGPKALRLGFDAEATSSEAVRKAMVAMVKAARAALG